MLEQATVLRKIEQLIDKLPYRSAEIRIELPQETLVISKEKQLRIGFDTTRCKKRASKETSEVF